MSNIPDGPIIDVLNWLQTHQQLWESNPATIGLTAAQVTAFKGRVQDAVSKYDSAQQARRASKDATTSQASTLREARRDASALINTIKAFIENSGNPNLWATAGLNPPSPRGTAPPPNAPTDLVATIDGTGNLIISWKATQPAGAVGTVYVVRRALNNATAFTLLDIVGEKSYTDGTVPLGTTAVSYYVTARRLGQESQASATLRVQFGRAAGGGGGGFTIASETLDGRPVDFKQAA